MGLSLDHPISRIVTASRAHRYAMGVSEMQRETIMRSL
jgi:alkylation response protein AidB-like acyl-CoA dehydrogenase